MKKRMHVTLEFGIYVVEKNKEVVFLPLLETIARLMLVSATGKVCSKRLESVGKNIFGGRKGRRRGSR